MAHSSFIWSLAAFLSISVKRWSSLIILKSQFPCLQDFRSHDDIYNVHCSQSLHTWSLTPTHTHVHLHSTLYTYAIIPLCVFCALIETPLSLSVYIYIHSKYICFTGYYWHISWTTPGCRKVGMKRFQVCVLFRQDDRWPPVSTALGWTLQSSLAKMPGASGILPEGAASSWSYNNFFHLILSQSTLSIPPALINLSLQNCSLSGTNSTSPTFLT